MATAIPNGTTMNKQAHFHWYKHTGGLMNTPDLLKMFLQHWRPDQRKLTEGIELLEIDSTTNYSPFGIKVRSSQSSGDFHISVPSAING